MEQKSRNSKKKFGSALVLALIAGSAAYGQDVRSNYLPGTDFSKYRTYSWVTIEDVVHPDQIIDAEIKRAIDTQMGAKGFAKVDNGASEFPLPPDLTHPPDLAHPADLVIRYQVAIDHEKQWTAYGMADRFPWSGMGTAMGTATSSSIDVGTLVLDIYDAAAKQLVWTGSATKTISLSKDQRKNQKQLDKAMEKLLKDFPPRQK
jgi:hypothetical protein